MSRQDLTKSRSTEERALIKGERRALHVSLAKATRHGLEDDGHNEGNTSVEVDSASDEDFAAYLKQQEDPETNPVGFRMQL